MRRETTLPGAPEGLRTIFGADDLVPGHEPPPSHAVEQNLVGRSGALRDCTTTRAVPGLAPGLTHPVGVMDQGGARGPLPGGGRADCPQGIGTGSEGSSDGD